MSGVQGKLSGRVMNMKFMRFAKDDSGSEAGTRESSPSVKEESVGSSRYSDNNSNSNSSGFHDSSEWFAETANQKNLDKNEKTKKKHIVRARRGPIRAVVADNISVTHLQMQNNKSVRTTNNTQTDSIAGNIGRRKFNEISKKRKVEDDSTEDTDDYELDRMFKDDIKRRKTTGIKDSNNEK
ncbi:similar to Saccharomyces cerevisiae YNR024W MPP6 Nuclear exosome-associated RNA binding protein [Maudiozyma barnettii]|uniref:Similar to Saccharomyces cerevisiae YNR024W MPP6 Nuclear exosome-associated RNA binding protein n=1 Tax=Maudiozyma barnettii TaxID=61262 RepID=A0A8H2VGU8_9SACH|nr:Mpp6p [Kazachstania barnettii]CAB4255409.1 similar to Saccharomyces cerevisiae YNR024W MPP6 Nuclear exosome-associated RNA binding protein [Kazachstania barnettii]CAD1783821.1 similar to Saccharomyces cerevisiae YNR024W MPP6 Nuclear exosome-associated RNA binding protein [Kazachstania barnettii]